MINHARTLLLNKPGSFYQPGELGEEYIPANYAPVYMPSYIQAPRRIIFGTDPDRAFINYRLNELFSLLHQTELAEFVYALDTRVTYWPQETNPFFTSKFSPRLEKTAGLPGANLAVIGSAAADNIRGRALYEYFVRVIDSGSADIALITAVGQEDVTQAEIEWVAGFNDGGPSKLIPINNTGLYLQYSGVVPTSVYSLLLEDSADYLLLQSGDTIALTTADESSMAFSYQPTNVLNGAVMAQWQLKVYAQPANAIKFALPKLELLGEPLFLELFGLGNGEPFKTFRNVWFDHPTPAYRLGAFILAMIYRLNEMRKA